MGRILAGQVEVVQVLRARESTGPEQRLETGATPPYKVAPRGTVSAGAVRKGATAGHQGLMAPDPTRNMAARAGAVRLVAQAALAGQGDHPCSPGQAVEPVRWVAPPVGLVVAIIRIRLEAVLRAVPPRQRVLTALTARSVVGPEGEAAVETAEMVGMAGMAREAAARAVKTLAQAAMVVAENVACGVGNLFIRWDLFINARKTDSECVIVRLPNRDGCGGIMDRGRILGLARHQGSVL